MGLWQTDGSSNHGQKTTPYNDQQKKKKKKRKLQIVAIAVPADQE